MLTFWFPFFSLECPQKITWKCPQECIQNVQEISSLKCPPEFTQTLSTRSHPKVSTRSRTFCSREFTFYVYEKTATQQNQMWLHKGQLISKQNYSAVTFPKKQTKCTTVVHEGTESQNQSLQKAIIWFCYTLNWLFWTCKHNILLSGMGMKWIYAI